MVTGGWPLGIPVDHRIRSDSVVTGGWPPVVAGTTMHATAQGLAAERGMLEARAPTAQVEGVGAEEPPAAGVPGTRALDGGMVDTRRTRSKNGGAQPTAVYADSAANEV